MDPHLAACMMLSVPETPPLRMHNPPPRPLALPHTPRPQRTGDPRWESGNV